MESYIFCTCSGYLGVLFHTEQEAYYPGYWHVTEHDFSFSVLLKQLFSLTKEFWWDLAYLSNTSFQTLF